MSKAIEQLQTQLQDILGERIAAVSVDLDEITLEIAPTQLLTVCRTLRSHADLAFTLLIDICGVDYS